jgi:hypothetical protein
MKHLVVIGDIVLSRRLPDRAEVQDKLERVLEELNRKHANELASPYTITLGDEFQAVYRDATPALRDAIRILEELSPTRVRFALSSGTIATRINAKQALGMDGPAFHNARAAITELKARNGLLAVTGTAIQPGSLVADSLDLVSSVLSGWDGKRFQMLRRLLETEPWIDGGSYGKSIVKGMATEIGISERAVYKSFKAHAIKPIAKILSDVGTMLDASMRLE